MCTDCDRLRFVRERDGTAKAFARQCVHQYRRACRQRLADGGRADREFRKRWAQGYLVAKRYQERQP